MNLQDLLRTLISLIIALGSAIGLRALIRHWAKGAIDHQFAEKLEKLKHELQLDTERRRFDYSLRTMELELLVKSKHERYAKLFELASTAWQSVRSLRRLRYIYLDFSKHDVKEIDDFMVQSDIPNILRNQLRKLFLKDRGLAELRLESYLKTRQPKSSEHDVASARTYLHSNEVFICDEVRQKMYSLLKELDLFISAVAMNLDNEAEAAKKGWDEYKNIALEEWTLPDSKRMDAAWELLRKVIGEEVGSESRLAMSRQPEEDSGA